MPFITWLRSVNPDWNLVPANVLFAERSEKSGAEDVHLTPSQKLGVLPQAEYVERTGAQVVRNRTGAENMKHVEPGDFISHLRSFQGGLEYSALAGKVSNAYTVITPRVDLVDGYYRYLFKSSLFIEGLGNITDQLRDGQTINFARFSQFGLPLPPLETQRAIADYLDRETAEIDAMSADLDEMEALLTERRSAVIVSTIERVKSTNPSPQLGSLVQMHSGSGFPHSYQGKSGNELHFYKVGSLSMLSADGTIEDPRNTISRQDAEILGAKIIPQNSVLLAKIGAALLLARFVRNNRPCCVDNNMLALVPNDGVEARYLQHALSLVDINLLERSGPVPTLDMGGFRQHRVPLPPLDEQRRIADEIDRETAEIDAMLADITELRDLLAERRAAIIAAAVTGQIDIPVHEEATHA